MSVGHGEIIVGKMQASKRPLLVLYCARLLRFMRLNVMLGEVPTLLIRWGIVCYSSQPTFLLAYGKWEEVQKSQFFGSSHHIILSELSLRAGTPNAFMNSAGRPRTKPPLS